MSDLHSKLVGKLVTLVFKEEAVLNGLAVKNLTGTCGGIGGAVMSLNGIVEARDGKGQDVTNEGKLIGKALILNVDTLAFVIQQGD